MMTHNSKRSKHSIIRHINLARKQRTILFSDIVQSARFWSINGDVQGRLMLDRHNWLLFPIVKKFKGHIIKTIGDSIFASFKDPNLAVKASIAMQQILEKERTNNPTFKLAVRIGLHTGNTIVEHHDVYGDTVNIASRIESRGKGSEILLSSETKKQLIETFPISFKETFKAKGIEDKLEIYQCHWEESPDHIQHLKLPTRLPLIPRQRLDMVIYSVCGLLAIIMITMLYLRFFLSDSEAMALIMFNPILLFTDYPLLLLPIAAIIAGAIVAFRKYKFHTISLPVMHVIKGMYGFFLFFVISYLCLSLFPKSIAPYLYETTFESKHLFVRSISDQAVIRKEPKLTADPIKTLKSSQMLLLADVKKVKKIGWNKVLIRRATYGWVPRVLPPAFGVARERITLTNKFYFRHLDIFALLTGLVGFVWGIITFRMRPA